MGDRRGLMSAPPAAHCIRWPVMAVMLVLLAACAGGGRKDGAPGASAPAPYEPLDGPPSVPFDVDQLPEPEVRAEPRSRYGNHTPYVVLGKRYYVRDSANGYRERGTASWYGTKFHGRLTSNREPYDMYAFSAAHKTLPLPTYARVTNLRNGRSVVVRINDRGPFVGDRLIDLSYAAAVKLGVHLTGTAPVEVEALAPGGVPLTASASAPADGQVSYLQVGAFAEKKNAKALSVRLHAAGLRGVKVVRSKSNGMRVYRVRIGPIDDESEVHQVDRTLLELGLPPAMRIRRPAEG